MEGGHGEAEDEVQHVVSNRLHHVGRGVMKNSSQEIDLTHAIQFRKHISWKRLSNCVIPFHNWPILHVVKRAIERREHAKDTEDG